MDILEWLELAALSTEQIARGPLGAASAPWHTIGEVDLPLDLWGVYIPLISNEESVQLGLLAPSTVCVQLAKALLGMSEEEAFDADEDVFDAVGEIANMVAGGMKAAARTVVTLGLPLAIQGRVFPPSGSRSAQGLIKVDGSEVWLVVTAASRPRGD